MNRYYEVQEVNLDEPRYAYIIAYTLAFFSFIAHLLLRSFESSFIQDGWLIRLAAVLICLGYLMYVFPFVKKLWAYAAFKAFAYLFHAIVLVGAVFTAKTLVASAINLPPEDFDITVSLLSIPLYPLIWLALGTLVLILTIPIFFLIGILLTPVLFVIDVVRDYFRYRKLVSKNKHGLEKYYGSNEILLSKKYGYDILSHCVSAFLVLGLVFYNTSPIIESTEVTEKAIEHLVYYFDYSDIDRYPCIDKQKKVKVHRNNVVSYASATAATGVVIEVTRLNNSNLDCAVSADES